MPLPGVSQVCGHVIRCQVPCAAKGIIADFRVGVPILVNRLAGARQVVIDQVIELVAGCVSHPHGDPLTPRVVIIGPLRAAGGRRGGQGGQGQVVKEHLDVTLRPKQTEVDPNFIGPRGKGERDLGPGICGIYGMELPQADRFAPVVVVHLDAVEPPIGVAKRGPLVPGFQGVGLAGDDVQPSEIGPLAGDPHRLIA